MTNTKIINTESVETKPRINSVELYGEYIDDETGQDKTGVVINFDPPLIDEDGTELVLVLNKEIEEEFREYIKQLTEEQLGEDLRI